MKKYFLHIDNKVEGPFILEELKLKNLRNDTPVWYEGLAEWTTAEYVQELQVLLYSTTPPPYFPKQTIPPPPINKDSSNTFTIKKKDKSNRLKILGLLFSFLLLTVIIIFLLGAIFKKKSEVIPEPSSNDVKTYKEKVLTIQEIEEANPSKFIEATGNYNQNFGGTKFIIHGTVDNKATVTNFKDVVLEFTFYSATKTKISTKQYIIYDYYPAHSKKEFELKVEKTKGAATCGWKAVGATSYSNVQ